jgi:hypothetical protein
MYSILALVAELELMPVESMLVPVHEAHKRRVDTAIPSSPDFLDGDMLIPSAS